MNNDLEGARKSDSDLITLYAEAEKLAIIEVEQYLLAERDFVNLEKLKNKYGGNNETRVA